MQYLLTEEEYQKLKKSAEKPPITKATKEELLKFCKMVAENLPIDLYGDGELSPWGCIIDSEDEHVCDLCPSRMICPYEYKEWSK